MNRINLKTVTETVVLISILTAWLITVPAHSFESNLDIFTHIIVWAGLFIYLSNILLPRYLLTRKIKIDAFYFLLAVSLSLILLVFIRLVHLEEMYYRRFYIISTKLDYIYNFQWRNFSDLFWGSLALLTGATLYGFLTTINYTGTIFLRSILPRILSGLAIIVSLIFVAFVVNENIAQTAPVYVSNGKNENITFLEDETEFFNLSDLIMKMNVENKPICILFWTPSCCSQYFSVKKMDTIKLQLNEKDVEYLYVCGEYDGKSSRWKEFIETENVEGSHIFLSRKEFHKILVEDIGVNTGVPRVILLDKTHNHMLLNSSFSNIEDKLSNAFAKR